MSEPTNQFRTAAFGGLGAPLPPGASVFAKAQTVVDHGDITALKDLYDL